MENLIHVSMGDVHFSSHKQKIATFVGSCVALCMYSQENHCGGMAHIMLAGSEKNKKSITKSPGKYSVDAINRLLDDFQKNDVSIDKIKAKLVGGAQIFKHENGNGLFNIGKKNIDSIRETLNEKGILIKSEDLGASHGRWVYLDVESGDVEVKGKKRGNVKI